jgi:hypothetical protein
MQPNNGKENDYGQECHDAAFEPLLTILERKPHVDDIPE